MKQVRVSATLSYTERYTEHIINCVTGCLICFTWFLTELQVSAATIYSQIPLHLRNLNIFPCFWMLNYTCSCRKHRFVQKQPKYSHGKLYIVFTVHLIIIGRVHFYTNLCTQSYSIISLFSPIHISAYLKRHLQGGHKVYKHRLHNPCICRYIHIYITYKM
jgi:hypothetical protein